MPPKVSVAVEPESALDPSRQLLDNPSLCLLVSAEAAIVIGKYLVPKTVNRLAILSGFDDVPAGMRGGHAIIVIVTSLSPRQGIGDLRPHSSGQALALAQASAARRSSTRCSSAPNRRRRSRLKASSAFAGSFPSSRSRSCSVRDTIRA